MTDKIKTFAFCLLIFAVFALGFMLLGGKIGYDKGRASCPQCHADTIVVERIDTVTLVGKIDTLTRIVWKPYPVTVYDTVTVNDTTYIVLPYEHRLYEVPDTLKVWYSGVDPCIDSTMVYVRHTVITNTVTKIEYKMPRLTAELGAGAFYLDKSVNPYLLGEIRWNQPKTTFAAYGAIDHQGRWGAGVNVTYRIDLIK